MIVPALTSVFVRDLCLFGYHGVLSEETRIGQRFVVDIEIRADLSGAIATDDYEQAVCYGTLCDIASEIVTGQPLALIETVAGRIAATILERLERVMWVRVAVHKPSAPVPYVVSETAVAVEQARVQEVAFSLGSNLGEREAVLAAAVDRLSLMDGLEIANVSSLYDSAPWGGVEQPAFVNICVTGWTTLEPHAVLRACKTIEADLGRMPGVRWGARAIDIDLLYQGTREVRDRVLTLPHVCLFERAFVLEPLAEIDPDHVIGGRRVRDALAVLPRSPGDVIRRAPDGTGRWGIKEPEPA
ncbi:dihydroneopterin aldolase [Gluconobacter kanchanaburiensis]|uniref:Bifunctional folate synthesis protein n=1 Tax=Gluconobacter kanchanaburiensis NBRC 103587 TaxID=1307948 RepID=A0A511B8I7_9PROT|nr:dihydroneopterin aldolase [Gluconobacter kanchanaburiensis]MBF0861069.1 dihydroneopterin aldolase [Gluconobacter kanchanaburiensis]GBR70319.1 bifunctional folate synthesis protein [Gluconobacter kanchanaburiensis NBRC 103587]GEK96765.1 7,8-dihydroneopterin aldolase [Gluconobacter kanchanaburiensis NBRC 103587]